MRNLPSGKASCKHSGGRTAAAFSEKLFYFTSIEISNIYKIFFNFLINT